MQEYRLHRIERGDFSVESEEHYEALMQFIARKTLELIEEDPIAIHWVTITVGEFE